MKKRRKEKFKEASIFWKPLYIYLLVVCGSIWLFLLLGDKKDQFYVGMICGIWISIISWWFYKIYSQPEDRRWERIIKQVEVFMRHLQTENEREEIITMFCRLKKESKEISRSKIDIVLDEIIVYYWSAT
ncbi:MAG: hypothetical protein FJ130_04155 [Deltaproteobacteria bacterium]|nr:hypothetical protein [Deltaproteobacteria bacterium]